MEPIEITKKTSIDDNKIDDDMYNYQCSVMEFMILIRNFKDAISEGDGDRIIRTWKFMLPYMKVDGSGSRKYAVEGFHLLCQVTALLSERDAYRLIWNRSVKKKNGLGKDILKIMKEKKVCFGFSHFDLQHKCYLD